MPENDKDCIKADVQRRRTHSVEQLLGRFMAGRVRPALVLHLEDGTLAAIGAADGRPVLRAGLGACPDED